MNQLPALFQSPSNGEFDYSNGAILQCLGIKKIEDEPVVSATIVYRLSDDLIEAGQGKYYGLAFFYYCLQKYGTEEEKLTLSFTITFPMVVEAMLYYGAALWSDDTRSHSSIAPFRVAAQDVKDITVQLKYEPHH
ncbi:MAG: hypothetical protein A2937_02095 [Candidatus Yonathbacteria bacterium RIFCSPLOWO2_01_FULL_47_33b]|uniref:Uncharacterized protein n=1 Tax=Candidatus Yonathbacteria bacterium RIFCSPLOWO2_01_FULL_47_33b TaxID=1802727 RepID=A0A1G2SH17_9BACT|nr:MAG: hypothetical protein A2937_02095 [Candidatus Yonathbacteria bacterium RIFCSPLOWO2_01_FULL_47_33b]